MKTRVPLRAFMLSSLLLLGLSIPVSLGAQIRQAVAVVRPHLGANGYKAYGELVTYYQLEQRYDESNYFKSLQKEQGWGSGFFLNTKGGLLFVTCRHVVAFCDTVDLEFIGEDNAVKKLEGCPVIFRDDNLDFALIKVEADKLSAAGVEAKGLDLAEALPTDGSEVWAAGYPASALRDPKAIPVWQLTKGTVSNRKVVLQDIGVDESTIAIQHTATIDSGNSGGPLFMGNISDPSTWKVVGINSLKSYSRDNVNLACSLDEVLKAVNNYTESSKPDRDKLAAMTEKANSFVEAMNQDKLFLSWSYKYVSYKLAADQGWRILSTGYSRLRDNEKEAWGWRFFHISPAEVLRQFVTYSLYNSLHLVSSPAALAEISEITIAGIPAYRTKISSGNNNYTIDWAEEDGTYKIIGGRIQKMGLNVTQKVVVGKRVMEGAISKGMPKEALNSEEKSPQEPIRHAPRRFTLTGAYALLPLVSGYQSKVNLQFGYTAGIFPWLSVGALVSSANGTSYYVVDGIQTIIEYFELAVPIRLNLDWDKSPLLKAGLFPYFILEPSVGIYDFLEVKPCAALSGGLGLQIAWTANNSFGLECLARFELLESPVPRLNALPIRAFLTF